MSERRTEQPLADINYGVGRRIQLKFEIPWLHVREHGESAGTGPGNADYGVKWRFLGEEGKRVAWSIYPPLEVNSSKTMLNKGLVADGPRFLLPTEFTVEMGHIEINGEVGRNVVRGGDDEWIYGVSTEIIVRRGLELLGELHGEQSRESPVLSPPPAPLCTACTTTDSDSASTLDSSSTCPGNMHSVRIRI